MNCPKCNTPNDPEHLFCVNCGGSITPPTEAGNADLPPTVIGANVLPPTQVYPSNPPNNRDDSPDSIPTAFRNPAQFNPSMHNFDPSIYNPGAQPIQRSNSKFIWLGALALLLMVGGIGAFFIINKQSVNAEILPDHLGMFVQNKDKNGISEISKQDFANAVQAKDDLLKNESLPNVEGKPNLILYSDGKDVPLNDLKLVQLDTIKDDGSLKQINYQAVPVEGKPEMKRLRIPDGLADGKYAFALFDGFLDEGKHKFWAFKVNNAEKSDNGDLAKAMMLSLKPKASPTPQTVVKQQNVSAPKIDTPTVPPPSGGRVAYSKTNKLILRDSPSLYGRDTGVRIRNNQIIYIINYTGKYDSWKNMYGEWAYVQTQGGSRGYVFTPLIRY